MLIKETKDLTNIYKDMILQFPPEELKTLEELKKITGEKYKFYDCIIDSAPIGYFALFETDNFLMLDYFAVFKNLHSMGFGSQILKSIQKIFPNKQGLFLEVEKPDEEVPNTYRRIKFYESHGAKRLNVNYLFPTVNGAIPLDLYFLPFEERLPSKDEIRIFIHELFNNIHKNVPNLQEIEEKIWNK